MDWGRGAIGNYMQSSGIGFRYSASEEGGRSQLYNLNSGQMDWTNPPPQHHLVHSLQPQMAKNTNVCQYIGVNELSSMLTYATLKLTKLYSSTVHIQIDAFDPNPQYTVHYTVHPLNKDMLKEQYREKVFYHSALYVG